jgi:hypothetical protein
MKTKWRISLAFFLDHDALQAFLVPVPCGHLEHRDPNHICRQLRLGLDSTAFIKIDVFRCKPTGVRTFVFTEKHTKISVNKNGEFPSKNNKTKRHSKNLKGLRQHI